MAHEGSTLWAKNLPLDQALHRFTVGDDPLTDLALLPWDIVGSAAHARTLAEGGFLARRDFQSLLQALKALHAEALAGRITITPEMEDGHTALELALVSRCGEAGKRIHLGRSRNDQVILALRLLLREELARIGGQVIEVAMAFTALAERNARIPMPGYTHLRRAMPSTWGLWATAFAEGLLEEVEALGALLIRLDRCPAGAAAGFGAPLPLDRERMAELLGFSQVQRNPIDVMNSRGRHEGAIADWLASVASVLEKALWDLALFSMEEIRFVALPDAFTTGSSIMPQKRNPDVLELARATCRLLRGQASVVHEVAGGLPSSYHRDLQLLKAPILDMLRHASGVFSVLPALIEGLVIDPVVCKAACGDELYAAHAATSLALEGMTFRDAYQEVAHRILQGEFVPDYGRYPGAVLADIATPRGLLQEHLATLRSLRTHWRETVDRLWAMSDPGVNDPTQECS